MTHPDMTAIEALAALRERGEHHRIEAKRGSEVGKAVMESICAFANEPGLGGGHLFLGVSADSTPDLFDTPSYQVVGVSNPEAMADEIASRCATEFNNPVRPRISPEEIEGRTLLHVFVPEAAAGLKPIFFKARGLPGGALRRIGGTDQKATEDDLQLFFTNRSNRCYDGEVAEGATLDDLDSEAIESYRNMRSDVSAGAEELSYTDSDLLLALRAVENVNGELRPTVAGLLLFGRPISQRRVFPLTRIDYIRVPGKEWVPDPQDRFESVEIRSPLLQAVRRAEAAVMDDLPKAFQLSEGSLQRREVPPLPQRVMREAIVNAVIHRDYRVQGAIQIIRYSNRIEIHNPGFSLKAPERLGEPGSASRNPTLAGVFYDTGLAETKGTGIRAMRQLMKEAELMPPSFESDRGGNRFVARFLLHHFLTDNDLAWLESLGLGQRSAEEKLIAVFAREMGAVDNATCRDLTDMDTLAASQLLRRLCDLGVLEKKGRSTATFYVPSAGVTDVNGMSTEALPSAPTGEQEPTMVGRKPAMAKQQPTVADQQQPSMASAKPTMVTGRKPTMGAGKPAEATGEVSRSLGSPHESADTIAVANLRETMPRELRESVEALGRRADPADIRQCIERLCAWRSLTAAQLSGLLDRSLGYLKDEYLRPMMSDGVIAYTIPEMPKHPRQEYRTVAERGGRS